MLLGAQPDALLPVLQAHTLCGGRPRSVPPRAVMKCRKVRYRDRIGALLALAAAERSESIRRREVRAYPCPKCKGWHLTSKGKR